MNKIYRSLDNIHASESLKSSALSKCMASRTTKKAVLPQVLAACLAAVFLISGIGVFHASTAEAAYISIDVNPSIGLSLNKFKRVIGVDAYNEEAAQVIEALDLKGQKYTDAIDDIMSSEILLGYDTSASDIYIESDSDTLNQEISDTIQRQCPNANLSCHNAENKETAMEYNISPGKYYLIEQIIEYGGTIEDFKDLPMHELKEIYNERCENDYSQSHHGGGQSGNGQQQGGGQSGSAQQQGGGHHGNGKNSAYH